MPEPGCSRKSIPGNNSLNRTLPIASQLICRYILLNCAVWFPIWPEISDSLAAIVKVELVGDNHIAKQGLAGSTCTNSAHGETGRSEHLCKWKDNISDCNISHVGGTDYRKPYGVPIVTLRKKMSHCKGEAIWIFSFLPERPRCGPLVYREHGLILEFNCRDNENPSRCIRRRLACGHPGHYRLPAYHRPWCVLKPHVCIWSTSTTRTDHQAVLAVIQREPGTAIGELELEARRRYRRTVLDRQQHPGAGCSGSERCTADGAMYGGNRAGDTEFYLLAASRRCQAGAAVLLLRQPSHKLREALEETARLRPARIYEDCDTIHQLLLPHRVVEQAAVIG